MSRKNPNAYPVDLRGMVGQLNIQGARSRELLELLKEIPLSHPRLGEIMDQHVDACILFLRLSEKLTDELIRRSYDE